MRKGSRAWVDAWCGSQASVYQRLAGILSPVILSGVAVYLLLLWPSLPDRIPTHYNFAGEIDGWGSRASLWLMPSIGLLVDLLMAVTGRFPQSWNCGVKITVLNRVAVYRVTRDLMADLRLACALLFAFLTVLMSRLAEQMSGWPVLVVSLALVLIPILRFAVRILRVR